MPLKKIDWYLKDSTPATEFIKEAIAKEDSVIITDTADRNDYLDAEEIYDGMEIKLHKVVLDETDIKEDVEKVLKQFTKDKEPPHLFINRKYFASNQGIADAYEKGELEETLGLPAVPI